MMSILGCSAGELGEVLKSLGFRLERRPIVAVPVDAPAAATAPEANSETQTQPAEEAGTAAAATPEPVEAPAAEPATSEATEAAVNGETAVPQGETQAGGEPQSEKFEEIWRPRRHHRREGAHREWGREGRHRRGKPKYDRGTPVSAPSAEGNAPPAAAAAETNDAERRPDQRSDRPRFERRGGDTRRGENHARRDEGGKPRRDHEKRPNRQGDNRHEGRRRDESRRSPQVVTAAPPKSGSAESSSPFAALAALKAQMEKRSEGSGST
jgi:ATP-dependent RNA helicase SUPV3L1/SUV3